MFPFFAFNPVNLENLVNPVYCRSSSFLRALRVLRGEIFFWGLRLCCVRFIRVHPWLISLPFNAHTNRTPSGTTDQSDA